MTKTIQDFLLKSEALLKEAGIEEPRFEARYLLCFAAQMELQTIIAYPERMLSGEICDRAFEYVMRRKAHEPVAHITGEKEFWSLSFKVTKDTLIPRADSETIIEAILGLYPDKNLPLDILDLGVGTGCLVLSALSEYPQAKGVGVDVSRAALDVANENANKLGLKNRCVFLESSWTEELDQKFDLVIANPPYIDQGERSVMSREVLEYEPQSALFADHDGLSDYEHIMADLARILKPGGRAVFEIGYRQAEAVSKIITDYNFIVLEVKKDLNNNDRVIIVQR